MSELLALRGCVLGSMSRQTEPNILLLMRGRLSLSKIQFQRPRVERTIAPMVVYVPVKKVRVTRTVWG